MVLFAETPHFRPEKRTAILIILNFIFYKVHNDNFYVSSLLTCWYF